MANRPPARVSARRVGGSSDVAAGRPTSVPADGDCRGWPVARGCRRGASHVERGPHRRDVLGRRAAAAAHDAGPGGQHPGGHRGQVLGRRRVDEPVGEALRQAGVGHDRARRPALQDAGHLLQRVDAALRSGAAVHADDIRSGRRDNPGRHLRPGAVGQDQVLAEGQRGDDRQVGRLAGDLDRDEQLVEVDERLQDDDVDAALEQAVQLFAECVSPDRIRLASGAPPGRLEGPDRAANERLAPGHVTCFAGQRGGPAIEQPNADLQAGRRQPEPVRPERQRLDQLGARREVFPVGGPDEVRPAHDELFQARSLGNPPAVEERAHAAIGQQRALGQARREALTRGRRGGNCRCWQGASCRPQRRSHSRRPSPAAGRSNPGR